MIDRYKINKIVERLSLTGFEFETEEVIGNLYDTLAQYGYGDMELTDEEYYFLIDELLPLAEQFEFKEVEYLTFHKTTVPSAYLFEYLPLTPLLKSYSSNMSESLFIFS